MSFRHKGLARLYEQGSKRGVQPAHVPKLLRMLSALDVAKAPEDLAIPSFKTHPLSGAQEGIWSIWVNGNWRVTFRFTGQDFGLVNYEDYHGGARKIMKNPQHPGALVREDVIEALNLTVAEAAERLGVSRVTLSRVTNEHSAISPNLAVRLELAGVGTARSWLEMQVNYDLARELDGKSHDVKSLVA